MKLRSDSPFAKLTEDEIDNLVLLSSSLTLVQLIEVVKGAPEPIHCSITAMSRFLKKAKEEKMLRDAEASQESVEAFAKRGKDTKVREAALAVMRDRMFELMVDSNNAERLMEAYNALAHEEERDRALTLEERKVQVAEQNALTGQRRLEIEYAQSGLKMLPKLRELLMDKTISGEERAARALECLTVEVERPTLVTVGNREGGEPMKQLAARVESAG